MKWVHSHAPDLHKNSTPESGKEEQSEELETNCEQMLGRIMRNEWEAQQDLWMKQNKHGAGSSSSCCPGGNRVGRRNQPGEGNSSCAGSAPWSHPLQQPLLCSGCTATSH